MQMSRRGAALWWCVLATVTWAVTSKTVAASWATGDLSLAKVPQGMADKYGAKCIDGSPPAVYVTRNTSSTRWVVYFKGGGWCFNEADCLARSKTTLGSSTKLPEAFNWPYGVTQGDPAKNPYFASFNRVVLWYCDGGSWSGMRQDAVKASDGTPMWFRGRANVDAQFALLHDKFGFGDATEVLLGGGSAGALSSYLHANYVKDVWIPTSVRRLKLVPESGFFMNVTSVDGAFVYGDAIRYMANMMNSSHGVNSACVRAALNQGDGDWFPCMTAQGTLPHIDMPVFVVNSVHDYWQVMCVLTATATDGGSSESCSSAPGWHTCAKAGNDHLSSCNSTQITTFNAFGNDMVTAMIGTGAFKNCNGAFLSSCVTHVSMFSNLFIDLSIDGVTMTDAISTWWQASTQAPFSDHAFYPCRLDATSTNHQCNPTCL